MSSAHLSQRARVKAQTLADTVTCALVVGDVIKHSLSHVWSQSELQWKWRTAGINYNLQREGSLSGDQIKPSTAENPEYADLESAPSSYVNQNTSTHEHHGSLNAQAPVDHPTSTTNQALDSAAQYFDDTSIQSQEATTKRQLKPAPVPSSRISRLFNYGSLAVGIGMGAAAEAVKRATGLSSPNSNSSLLLSGRNVERIVDRLSRMRGAALKLGQMLSIQDNSMIPKELEQVLLRVQNSANYMPDSQLQRVMTKELGSDWEAKFSHFDLTPTAAASIGQVHQATTQSGHKVAVKVQYPGVSQSIDSDLAYLRSLALMGTFLPKGLYLDNTIRVAKMELAWECDYLREASAMQKFSQLLAKSKFSVAPQVKLNIPKVVPELTTNAVLTTDWVEGEPIGSVLDLPQHKRDRIGDKLLELCLKELFEYRFMQTDPNWSNFLYDRRTDTIHLLDFGATREFEPEFTNSYLQVLHAAAVNDREACVYWSRQLGFLTGFESDAMINAHVNSLLMLAEPFSKVNPGERFDFGAQNITTRVRSEIPTMLRERLTPPPEQTYSLHRKLSGYFLLCAKIRARVACSDLFQRAFQQHNSN